MGWGEGGVNVTEYFIVMVRWSSSGWNDLTELDTVYIETLCLTQPPGSIVAALLQAIDRRPNNHG